MINSDLSLASMENIWTELQKRNDAIVIISVQSLDENREQSEISYKGGQFICLGMLEKARAYLLKDMLADE